MTHDHVGEFSIDCVICLRERIAELEKYKQAVEDAMKEIEARGVVIYAHTVTDILDKHLSRLKEEPKP